MGPHWFHGPFNHGCLEGRVRPKSAALRVHKRQDDLNLARHPGVDFQDGAGAFTRGTAIGTVSGFTFHSWQIVHAKENESAA
jgi:hypothetical protein